MSASRLRLKPWHLGVGILVILLKWYFLFCLGISLGFPPSIRIGHWWNRTHFSLSEDDYRAMSARIGDQLKGGKPGDRDFFKLFPERNLASLQRLPPDTADETLDRLLDDERLVEAYRFKDGLVVRFVMRRVSGGGTYSLVWWDPKPAGDCVWWTTDWWENEHIDWIDGQWWSTYSTQDHHAWKPRRATYGLHGD